MVPTWTWTRGSSRLPGMRLCPLPWYDVPTFQRCFGAREAPPYEFSRLGVAGPSPSRRCERSISDSLALGRRVFFQRDDVPDYFWYLMR